MTKVRVFFVKGTHIQVFLIVMLFNGLAGPPGSGCQPVNGLPIKTSCSGSGGHYAVRQG